MKRHFSIALVLALVLSLLTACAFKPAGSNEPPAAMTEAPPETDAQDEPDASEGELRQMLARYKSDGNYEKAYEAARRLTELAPWDESAYIDAADALLRLCGTQFDEIDRLLEAGVQNAANAQRIAEWVEKNQRSFTLEIPFMPDYAETADANTTGVTTGNLSNAGKYGGAWRGGLLTSQGGTVYLARPDENLALYKLSSDSRVKRLGESSGSSLNAVGEWLYFLNSNDGDKPYRMRTDGSKSEKLLDNGCAFLSVSGDWMYFDNGNDNGRLYKARLDGSEKTKLTDETAMFSCAADDGFVYYGPKSNDAGLSRVSIDGGAPQSIARGFIQTYCVYDGYVYYVDAGNKTGGVQRVRTDGTEQETFFPFDFPITTFNIANNTLYIGFNLTYEEDGFFISEELVAIDIATFEKRLSARVDTEPICIGPDGQVYFMRYGDGLKWYALDENGGDQRLGG